MLLRRAMLPLMIAVLLAYVPSAAATFYAYSLTQAQARAQQDDYTEEQVATLGGINIFAGMVYDPASQELILVGQHVPEQPPATLDDLIVALRALLVHRSSPLVSIDPTPDTPRTGLQMVRFEGGLSNTQYGADLLAADILLKELSLNLVSAGVPQMLSYLHLTAMQRAQRLADEELMVSSRFWFTLGKDSALVERDGVFALRALRLSVESELLEAQAYGQPMAADFRDESSDAFADAVNTAFDALCAQHPVLARLRVLYSLVAMAKGMSAVAPDTALRYWLEAYPVRQVETPAHHTFHKQQKHYRDKQDRESFVEVAGGIALKATLLSLKAGDVTALRRAVLQSRPASQPLTWPVPIDDWRIPWARTFVPENPVDTPKPPQNPLGFYLTARSGLVSGRSLPHPESSERHSGFVPPPPPPLKATRPEFEWTARLPRQDIGQHALVLQSTPGLAGPGLTQTGGPQGRRGQALPSLSSLLSSQPGARHLYLFNDAKYARMSPVTFAPGVDFRSLTYTSGPSAREVHLAQLAQQAKGVETYGRALLGMPFVSGETGTRPEAAVTTGGVKGLTLGASLAVLHAGHGHLLRADPLRDAGGWLSLPALQAYEARARRDIGSLQHGFGGPHGGSSGVRSPLTPAPVGGIALRGASEAVKDVGMLKGIAFDAATGRLVLVSEEHGNLALPPLRLDDIVTVFRQVYHHGEAPSVSIDPDPHNPTGPHMLVRHGAGTPETYVGWVLFEADRLMKSYSLGHDNLTGQPFHSHVPGYQSLLTLGGGPHAGRTKGPIWERFWIVPAQITQHQASRQALTLIEVPLRVNTQRMALHKGRLVPARDDRPSPEGKAFQEWFTTSYAAIADEVRLVPPPACGIAHPVPVFTELQRIAVLAAVAERLRDQGVPLPAWMRDYPVTPCPLASTTPALTVEASQPFTNGRIQGTQTKRLHGGVQLSPADNARHITPSAPEAEALAPAVTQAIAATPPVASVALAHAGKNYRAVTLPGDTTQEVGANYLVETDVTIPVHQDTALTLVRHFHSFFQPTGALGSAWTLDLPRLEAQRRPIRRTQDTVEFATGYQLTSPLHTATGTFTRLQRVPEVQGELVVPEQAGPILGVGRMHHPRLGIPTQVVLFWDGRRWTFHDAGHLVAREDGPLTILYHWDHAQRRLERLEAWYGEERRAEIRLVYDAAGRIVAAQGSPADRVTYTYDDDNRLTRVDGPSGVWEYYYQEGLVTAVVHNGTITRRFTYTDRGRVAQEWRAGGTARAYQVAPAPDGLQVSATGTGQSGQQETALYDAARRPLVQVHADGTHEQWDYAPNGDVTTTLTGPQGEERRVRHTATGRQETWQLPGGGRAQLDYDAGGRLVRVQEGERDVLQQAWHGDGRLARAAYGSTVLHPTYREDGVLNGVLVTPPGEGPSFRQWLRLTYDPQGRVIALTDATGLATRISYDATGQPTTLVAQSDGVEVQRDPEGRVRMVQTSWGDAQHYRYDDQGGGLTRVDVTRGGQQAALTFHKGKLDTVQQFDGGTLTLAYHEGGPHDAQLQQVHTPQGLVVTYGYDTANRVAAVTYGEAYRLDYTYDAQGRVVGLRQESLAP